MSPELREKFKDLHEESTRVHNLPPGEEHEQAFKALIDRTLELYNKQVNEEDEEDRRLWREIGEEEEDEE